MKVFLGQRVTTVKKATLLNLSKNTGRYVADCPLCKITFDLFIYMYIRKCVVA